MSWFSSLWKAITSPIVKLAKAIDTAVHNIIKNPLPVIETIALTAVVGPEGLALTSSQAGASAVASAAVKAANGGSVKDIATAAVTSYTGTTVGEQAGYAVAQTGTTSDTLVKVASSAAGASTTGTLNALAQGKSLGDALVAGVESGVVGGLTTTAVEGIKTAVNEPAPVGTAPIEERSTSTTGETVAQGIEPATTTTTGQKVAAEPLIGSAGSQALSSIIGPTIYSSLFGKSTPSFGGQATSGAQPTTAQATPATSTPTQTTISPGSQALAQALRIGDVGAPIFGGDKEGGKKSGWNVESLRYMGNPEA